MLLHTGYMMHEAGHYTGGGVTPSAEEELSARALLGLVLGRSGLVKPPKKVHEVRLGSQPFNAAPGTDGRSDRRW